MKLQELLTKQVQLNEAIAAYPETPEQLAMALIEELGEVSRELRGDWRWWQWGGQSKPEVNREKLIQELVDVLKFILVGLLCFDEFDDKTTAGKYWEFDWAKWGNESLDLPSFSSIVEAFPDESGWEAIAGFTRICGALKISREDIEAAYMVKFEKNLKRIAQETPNA